MSARYNPVERVKWNDPYSVNKLWLFLWAIIFVLASCENDISVDDHPFLCEEDLEEGLLGIDLLNTPETKDFSKNVELGRELNIDFITLHLPWSTIETSPQFYIDPGNALQLLGEVARTNNWKLSLTIRPIDLAGKTVPSDLAQVQFNDEELIQRFIQLIDFIFSHISPDLLLNLQIGNEIDGYDTSQEHSEFWSHYGTFLKSVVQHINRNYPEVPVGFTGTLEGLVKKQEIFKKLLGNVNHLGVTYYPIESNFDVKSPDVVESDIDRLVQIYPAEVPLFFQEIGYQTSEVNNSNENKQAVFYCEFFRVWNNYSERIRSVNIVRLNDLSVPEAEESAGYYGISNKLFTEFLRTLGIRTHEGGGVNKQAFEVIKNR